MFYRPSHQYAVEAIQQFSPNIVQLYMATGEQRWYIIGCYLDPDETSTIESVVVALKELPQGSYLLEAGDFKSNIDQPGGDRREEGIIAALGLAGLEDMSTHFLPLWSPWCRDGRTWSMFRVVREVRSWTDYILGMDRRLFRKMSARDPRHNSDHYLVLGNLRRDPLKEHTE